ncbi:hypothetical protein H257_09942 [Aphanomyces astaci]|uniref:Uncharacterized protein n=1 Tax=Aphanomyces astaci TaxID=112090 RepID=W4GAK6_APHAT|nr:hypothetical protein H257_09942 [Aphanomyces astaci]ETV75988.1 hypothetical protein H257_09942 [Aphanomyces astaci]|eukprot:XP_009834630.1 hypothetical protein H257_09942 [Aphanomyces astaci]
MEAIVNVLVQGAVPWHQLRTIPHRATSKLRASMEPQFWQYPAPEGVMHEYPVVRVFVITAAEASMMCWTKFVTQTLGLSDVDFMIASFHVDPK